jgi:uncharacterized repeat protein (TIGR03843 family)
VTEPSPFLERAPIATDRALELLRRGELEVRGRMPYSSNATFLVDIDHDGLGAQAIYKPARGERPLWDFPEGLYRREVAAFGVSEDLGWGLVPPTIVREHAPLDVGSLQLFVPAVFEEHYFTIHEADDTHDHTFRRICAFDVVINNTDRKSGHCLLGTDGRIWCIDHGVALHHEFKLRTVIWDFAGDPVPDDIRTDLAGLLERGVSRPTRELLSPFEHDALLARTRALVDAGVFPSDDSGGHRWPWPLV